MRYCSFIWGWNVKLINSKAVRHGNAIIYGSNWKKKRKKELVWYLLLIFITGTSYMGKISPLRFSICLSTLSLPRDIYVRSNIYISMHIHLGRSMVFSGISTLAGPAWFSCWSIPRVHILFLRAVVTVNRDPTYIYTFPCTTTDSLFIFFYNTLTVCLS